VESGEKCYYYDSYDDDDDAPGRTLAASPVLLLPPTTSTATATATASSSKNNAAAFSPWSSSFVVRSCDRRYGFASTQCLLVYIACGGLSRVTCYCTAVQYRLLLFRRCCFFFFVVVVVVVSFAWAVVRIFFAARIFEVGVFNVEK